MRTTVGEVKQLVARAISETRGRLSPEEVLRTYEDLFINNQGKVPVEMLASFVGTEPDQVFMAAMRRAGLLVDRQGNVVERGHTPPPMKAVKI